MKHGMRMTAWAIMLMGCGLAAGAADWSDQYPVDWLNCADVKSLPYMSDGELRALCDHNIQTGARGAQGPETGSTLEFSFPAPVMVTQIRIVQQDADVLELTGDPDGKGAFPTRLAKLELKNKEAQARQWLTIPVNKTLYGFKLVATDGQPGYRSGYPVYYEIEIYSSTNITVAGFKPEAGKFALARGPELPLPKLDRKEIAFTPCVDFWMTGLGAGDKVPENYPASPGFQALLKQLREIDATGVRCFPESIACNNKVAWKSKLCPNYGTEALKALIDALHQNNLKCDFFSHAWLSPIQKEGQQAEMPYCRWDYPYEQSDFIFSKGLEKYYKVKYPCIISENDFHDKWLGIMKEVTERGMDGIYVLPDEYYYKGHYLPKTDCPACRAAFEKRYGFKTMPKKVEDTEQYRKWKTFEYEKLAEVFNDVAGELNKQKPGMMLLYSATLDTSCNTYMEHGKALDIMGAQTNFTGVMIYGGDPKHAAGAFPGKMMFGSIQTLGTEGAVTFPIVFYDYLLNLLMNGCTGINFYRLNYVEPYWDVVVKASKMMRLLETWDLVKSKSAAETCVLMSRASEDWWQVTADCQILDYINSKDSNLLFMDPKDLATVWSKNRQAFKQDDRVRHYQYERFRGMYSSQYIENILKVNGLQYDIRYSERPETLAALNQYKLIILPFSYSMSTNTFAALNKAVAAGTKVLIYDQLAPTDQFGNKYAKPLLEPMLSATNVTLVKTDLMKEWSSRTARSENLARITNLLASAASFNPNDCNVQYLERKVADDNLILYLGNLERDKPANAVVGLALPAGNYSLTVCSSLEGTKNSIALNQALVNGKPAVTADQLKSLSVNLAPGEVQLIHVQKAP